MEEYAEDYIYKRLSLMHRLLPSKEYIIFWVFFNQMRMKTCLLVFAPHAHSYRALSESTEELIVQELSERRSHE